MTNINYKKIAQFLYEVGTLRRLPRIHSQVLLENDLTDNIAGHSYRVAPVGWQPAKGETIYREHPAGWWNDLWTDKNR